MHEPRPAGDDDLRGSPSQDYRWLIGGFENVLGSCAHAMQDELPGIVETLEVVVVYAATTNRRAYGWFRNNSWTDRREVFGEIVINADLFLQSPENVLVTLIHELVHAYAKTIAVKDTSRAGRYHNSRFADLAMKAGLRVERDRRIGHVTNGLSPLGWQRYGDQVAVLAEMITLANTPGETLQVVVGGGTEDDDNNNPGEHVDGKYVFATCGCVTDQNRPVTIRVARGSWRPDAIGCHICQQRFTAG